MTIVNVPLAIMFIAVISVGDYLMWLWDRPGRFHRRREYYVLGLSLSFPVIALLLAGWLWYSFLFALGLILGFVIALVLMSWYWWIKPYVNREQSRSHSKH
jgi:amino acid transporter